MSETIEDAAKASDHQVPALRQRLERLFKGGDAEGGKP